MCDLDVEDVLQHGHRTPWSFPLPSHRSPAFFSAAIISVKSVKLSAPPRTAAKHTLASALVLWCHLGWHLRAWLVREVWTSSAWMCARAPRKVQLGCEVLHLDPQEAQQHTRHPSGWSGHLHLEDFQCNDSHTGAVSIME